MFITKAATGAPHVFTISVYGDKGGLGWEQAQPQLLQVFRQGKPTEILHRGADTLSPLARRSIRVPEPHPEGFREAFANIYTDFAERVASRITGVAPDPPAMTMPTIEDGIDSLAFVEACAESHRTQAPVRLEHS
jgi:predicted dehydrogenase